MKATSTLPEPQRTLSVAILILLVLFILLFVAFTYTFLHEGGHALTGLFFGQALTEFNVNFLNFDAHVKMIGSLNRSQQIVQSLAGAGLPLLVWFLFLVLVPRKSSLSLELLKLLGSLIVLNTLLAWIMIPIFYLVGKAPPDDVTNFLIYSQMPPLLLTFTALVLYVRGWALFLSKTEGLRNEIGLFHTIGFKPLIAGMRKSIPAMAVILGICILLTFSLNASAEKNPAPAISEDFVSVAEIDLSAQSYAGEALAQFALQEPTEVGVFVIVRGIDTTYFDLSVIGPDGYRARVLHGEGYSAYQDCCVWKEELPAGIYRVVLSSDRSPGSASVYLKTP